MFLLLHLPAAARGVDGSAWSQTSCKKWINPPVRKTFSSSGSESRYWKSISRGFTGLGSSTIVSTSDTICHKPTFSIGHYKPELFFPPPSIYVPRRRQAVSVFSVSGWSKKLADVLSLDCTAFPSSCNTRCSCCDRSCCRVWDIESQWWIGTCIDIGTLVSAVPCN